MHRRFVPLGWLAVLGAAGYVLAASTGPLLRRLADSGAGPDAAVAAAAAVAGWLVLGWLSLAVTVSVAEAVGIPVARRLAALAPTALRTAVQATLGASLVTGVLPLGVAHATAPAAPPAVTRTADRQPSPWPSLDRPAAPPNTYRVAPGDTLWAIAAAHLPGHPTAADIAAAWPRWWRVNREAIGDDPSLIRPGLELQVPRSRP